MWSLTVLFIYLRSKLHFAREGKTSLAVGKLHFGIAETLPITLFSFLQYGE